LLNFVPKNRWISGAAIRFARSVRSGEKRVQISCGSLFGVDTFFACAWCRTMTCADSAITADCTQDALANSTDTHCLSAPLNVNEVSPQRHSSANRGRRRQ
jgi:uncharacterized Fe-S radical SAM superfamily protein PflX